MSDIRKPAFDAATQPTLCKLARKLSALRAAKAGQITEQQKLDEQLSALAKKLGGQLRNKAEAAQMARAMKTATEATFERLIPSTIKLALANPEVVQQVAELEVLVLKGDKHVVSTVPALIGENGWMSCKVPLGQDYDSALLLGKLVAWCQMGQVHRLTKETETEAHIDVIHEGPLMVLDAMTRQGENIYQLEEGALIYFPASATHSTAGSAIVQIRPLILRKPISLLDT